MRSLPLNIQRETLFSSYARQNRAETWGNQVNFSCECHFPQSLSFFLWCYRIFLIPTTTTFCPLREYYLQFPLPQCTHTKKINLALHITDNPLGKATQLLSSAKTPTINLHTYFCKSNLGPTPYLITYSQESLQNQTKTPNSAIFYQETKFR